MLEVLYSIQPVNIETNEKNSHTTTKQQVKIQVRKKYKYLCLKF